MSKRPKITLDNFFRRKQLCHEINSIEISQSLADDVEDSLKGFPGTLHEAIAASEGVTQSALSLCEDVIVKQYTAESLEEYPRVTDDNDGTFTVDSGTSTCRLLRQL